jgi:hypothetical protein
MASMSTNASGRNRRGLHNADFHLRWRCRVCADPVRCGAAGIRGDNILYLFFAVF